MRALAVMPPEIIKELIPIAGDRSIFQYNLMEWRSIFQKMVNTEKQQPEQLISEVSDVIHYLDSSESTATNEYASSHLSIDNIENHVQREANVAPVIENQAKSDVELILRKTPSGRNLLTQFTSSGILDQQARKRLCHLIIDSELSEDPNKRISLSRCHSLAYQITTIFVKEHLATYFVPYVSFGPGLRHLAKGKLLDCLNNRRKSLRAVGVIQASSRHSRNSSSTSRSSTPNRILLGLQGLENTSLEENGVVEESVQWLHNSTDPWQLVELNWRRTTHYRLWKLSKEGTSIKQYFEEFPALKNPSGYLLLLQDFEVAYPGAVHKLYEKLPLFRIRIYALTAQKLSITKNQTEKDQLDSYVKCEKESEDASNIGCLLCLPYLLAITTLRKKKGTWRPSRFETRDSFITVVPTDSLVQETVTRRRIKLHGLGLTLQPFIIAVGLSIKEIKSYFVVVDDVFYHMTSCLEAVDCCFKIIMQLNAEYPSESSVIWAFLQQGFYEIITVYDKKYTAVNALLSEIGIEKITH